MSAHPITADDTIRDILARRPATRAVFDRFGLMGCGGSRGPAESVELFARAHNVDVGELLDELNAAPADPEAAPADTGAPAAEDLLWRRFFKAAIVVTLTAGATWGAVLLAKIALAGSFTSAVGVQEVNAHGFAQIFGWLGLFVMGFAYQAFPRFRRVRLPRPRLALATLPVMLVGIVLRSAAEPFAAASGTAGLAALLGNLLVVVAVAAFAWIVLETFSRSREAAHPGDAFLGAGVLWFLVAAAAESAHFLATATAGSPQSLVRIVADWQVPLRDLQFHGFALMMVLGVSLRLLPGFFGVDDVKAATARLVFWGLNLALVAEVAGYLAMRAGLGIGRMLLALGWLGLLAGCAVLAQALGVWRRGASPDRSLKFIRAAYVWLLFSLTMLAATPGYLAVSGQEFSHAWFGATRHAITVGFFSMMILGVSSRVVPMLRGIEASRLGPLAYPFLLLNLGCGMRVLFQVLTDFSAQAFPVMGISSLFEVSALVTWAVPLWRTMNAGAEDEAEAEEQEPIPAGRLTGDETVAQVLRASPDALSVLVSRGFHALTNPFMRKTLAKGVTLRQACRMHDVDLDGLLRELAGDEARMDRANLAEAR